MTEEGEELAVTVTLDGSQVQVKSSGGEANDILAQTIQEEKHAMPGSKVGMKDSPIEWFHSLPRQYHGSYLQAYMRPTAATVLNSRPI